MDPSDSDIIGGVAEPQTEQSGGGDISGGYHITKAPPPLPQESDQSLLARTAIAEGGPSTEGQTAVIRAILQRHAESGKSIPTLLTEPGQIEAYWRGTLQKVDPKSPAYQQALGIAQTATPSPDIDSWGNPDIIKKRGWGHLPFDPSTGVQIGGQLFGKGYVSRAASAVDDDAIGGAKEAPEAGPPGAAPGAPDTTKPPYPGAVPVQLDGKFIRWAEPGQSAEIRRRAQLGPSDPNHFDIGAELGSQSFPRAVKPGEDLSDVRGGTWVMDPSGRVYQHQDPDQWASTLSQLGMDFQNPGMIGFRAGAPQLLTSDPRAQATENAVMNGMLFGGKNFIRAKAQQVATGQSDAQFNANLGQMNAQDVAQGQRFPLMRSGGALYGTGLALGAGEATGAGAAALGARLLPETAEAIQGSNVLRGLATGVRRGAAGYAYGYPSGYFAPPAGATEQQREASAGQMGTTGAVINELLPGAGSIAKATGRAIGLGGKGAAKAAPDAVANALANAFARDDIAPADAIAQARANPLAPAFHAGGYNVKQLADSAANAPGPAASTVREAVEQHQAALPGQIKADIGSAIGGQGNYLDTLDATMAARRTAANTAMDTIGSKPVSLDNNAVLALRSPVAQSAVKRAAQNALASAEPATREAGANLNRVADTVLDNPSAATMTVRDAQNVSRSLLTAADSAYKSGDGDTGQALKGLGRAIRDNAARSNTDYGAWLSRYGDDSDNIDALKLGHNVFSGAQANTAAAVRKSLADMGPQAQDYYTKGVAEGLIDQVRTQGVGAARRVLRNEDIQDKVRMAFPDDASYQAFVGKLDQRVSEDATNRAVAGGSPTYARQATRADLEAQPAHPLQFIGHAIDVGHALAGNPAPLTGRALKAVAGNIPIKDRSVIGDPVKNALLGEALTNPDVMENLLSNYGPRSLDKGGVRPKIRTPLTPALIQGTARMQQKNPLAPAPAFALPSQ